MSDSPDIEALRGPAESGDAEAQVTLGDALLARSLFQSDEFLQGLDWLERAAATGLADARLTLGAVYSHYAALDNAPARAYQCVAEAARDGHPQAVERVADLFLYGYGVPQDDAKAFSIYQQLAGYGFPDVLCQAGYMMASGLGCQPDPVAAADLFRRAAAQDCTVAWQLLGLAGIETNPPLAVALLERAAADGRPGLDIALRSAKQKLGAEGSSAAQAYTLALEAHGARFLSDQAAVVARFSEDADRHAAVVEMSLELWQQLDIPELRIGATALDLSSGTPLTAGPPQPASWQPRVFTLERFASDAECALMVDAALASYRAQEAGADDASRIEIDAFDGQCAHFPPHRGTPLIRNLQRRWASVLQVHEHHFEPMSVLRYQQDNEYSLHVDWFDAARMLFNREHGDFGGQRTITALIYLVAPQGGGETAYPDSETLVSGAPGSALIHYNTTPEGLPDPRSRHQGRPIQGGEKWVIRNAVRERALFGPRFQDL